MESTDWKAFLTQLFWRFDSTIDTADGSPVQTYIIQPLLERLGVDPLDTDIDAFVYDRLRQEYPNLTTTQGDALSDIIGVLKTVLEPLRREIRRVLQNQALSSAQIVDAEADALVSNTFTSPRTAGGYAIGRVKIYFQNPLALTVVRDNQVFTKAGLHFSPLGSQYCSAQQMLLNEENGLYCCEILVQAEEQGAEYNIGPLEIVGIEGIPNAARVVNEQRFYDGGNRETTAQLIARAARDLTERSLNTEVGIGARFNEAYPGTFRTVQIVRHGDADMERDVATGSGGAEIYLAGLGLVIDDAFLIATSTELVAEASPKVGDTLKIFFLPGLYQGLVPEQRIENFIIEAVGSPISYSGVDMRPLVLNGTPSQHAVSEKFFPSIQGTPVGFMLTRLAPLAISSIPGGIDSDTPDGVITIPPNEIHLGGHQDVYLNSYNRDVGSTAIRVLEDMAPLAAGEDLACLGGGTTCVSSASKNFTSLGVRFGDALVVKTTVLQGAYRVLRVEGSNLYLDVEFTTAVEEARFYVTRWVEVDLIDPKQIRVPFGVERANKLVTIVGSTVVDTTDVDLLHYGAEEGDSLRILSGVNGGDYTIERFQNANGKRPILLKPSDAAWTGMAVSDSDLEYIVFVGSAGLPRPLVRLTSVELLDNEEQPSGVRVPYARPVRVEALSAFAGALNKATSDLGIIIATLPKDDFPHGATFKITNGGEPLAPTEGWLLSAEEGDRTDFFVSLPNLPMDIMMELIGSATEANFVASSYPDPPLYGAQIGEILTIREGPNRGCYTIKDKANYSLGATLHGEATSFRITFIQIEETFPSPGAGMLHRVLEHLLEANPYTAINNDFDIEAGALVDIGLLDPEPAPDVTPMEAAKLLGAIYLKQHASGQNAQGRVRLYFLEPTTLELKNLVGGLGEDRLIAQTVGGQRFYLDRAQQFQLFPERDIESPMEYPRGLIIYAPIHGLVKFSDVDAYLEGLSVGDEVWVYECLYQHQCAPVVTTEEGSSIIRVPEDCSIDFGNVREGFYFSIESGEDGGMYVVQTVGEEGTRDVRLSRPMTITTPALEKSAPEDPLDVVGTLCTLMDDGGHGKFTADDVGKYVLIMVHPSVEQEHRGHAYLISAFNAGPPESIEFDCVGYLMSKTAPGTGVAWAIVATDVGFPMIRVYDVNPTIYDVSSVAAELMPWVELNGGINLGEHQGVNQPYRWVRRRATRISIAEMEQQDEQGLFCVDVGLISEGSDAGFNIPEGTSLQLIDGTYRSDGYVLDVQDTAHSHSENEELHIRVRSSLLPSGHDDLWSNNLLVPGKGIRIGHESSSLAGSFQAVANSDADRICVANTSVRHAVAALVYVTINYAGGSEPGVLEPMIRDLVEAVATTARLEVSDIEAIVSKYGANFIDQAIQLFVAFQGLDRVWVGELTKNVIDGASLLDFLMGSRRLAGYITGPNRAEETGIVIGERTSLAQL